MKYRQIKHTDLIISEVGFGTWPISGHGMGEVDEQKAIETILHAVELGINFFDTADMYGFGYAEELLAKTLGAKIKDLVIATKVGNEWDAAGNLRSNLQPDYIIQACENSLRRLKLETIDLYQLHKPDPDTPIEKTMQALLTLIESGKIRYVGLSNFSVEQLSEARRYLPIVSNQVEYSMLERSIEHQMIPYCTENEISILPYKVLGRGLLTGKFKELPVFSKGDWRASDAEFQEERFREILEIVDQLKPIAEAYDSTLSQLAAAWVLRLAPVASVIVGAKNAQQIEESCGRSPLNLKANDLYQIEQILNQLTEHQK
jgi:aryl-alcohol dehydrogenase-like predicted oxidoreductase